MGTKQPDSPLWRNLTLTIFMGKHVKWNNFHCNKIWAIIRLFLGDFTGNHVEDILVVSDTGVAVELLMVRFFLHQQSSSFHL